MEKINFNAGWTHYREGYETKAVIVNLPHDAMIYEDRIPKLKDGALTGFFPSADDYYFKNLFSDEVNIFIQNIDVPNARWYPGAGTLLGVGGGNPRTTEQYTGNAFTTYYGRMIAVVRSKNEAGEIKVNFSAEGVEDEVISINVK